MDTGKIPRNLRGVALVLATIALIPLVAFAANASDAAPPDEPEPDAPRHQPPPEPVRLGLRLVPDRLELDAGAEGRAAFVLSNDGPRAANVRVALDADHARGLEILSAPEMWYRLAPGEIIEGHVLVRAPAHEPIGFHVVRMEATVEDEERAPRFVTMAFLHVIVPPRPITVAPIDLPVPLHPATIVAPPGCPAWEPRTAWDEPARPCRSACEPCARPHVAPPPCDRPAAHEDDIVLRLLLRGRVVDGQLVIDLDDATRARLAAIAAS